MDVRYEAFPQEDQDKLAASIAYRVRESFSRYIAVSGDMVVAVLEQEKQAGNVANVDKLPKHNPRKNRLHFAVCFKDSSALVIHTTKDRIQMELGWELPVPGTAH